MKNSVLCSIHDVTACFTSSSQVKWVLLRSLLRWGKKWKSLGAKSVLWGGWERNSNFSVSRASIVARTVCGLALSRTNKIRDTDPLTRHTLHRRFFYCFNVPSWIDSIPSFQKFCHVNSLWVPKNSKRNLAGRRHFFLIFSGEEMKCARIACSVVFLQGQNDESMTHPQ